MAIYYMEDKIMPYGMVRGIGRKDQEKIYRIKDQESENRVPE